LRVAVGGMCSPWRLTLGSLVYGSSIRPGPVIPAPIPAWPWPGYTQMIKIYNFEAKGNNIQLQYCVRCQFPYPLYQRGCRGW
jgi:hypothetical protein